MNYTILYLVLIVVFLLSAQIVSYMHASYDNDIDRSTPFIDLTRSEAGRPITELVIYF